MEFRIERIGPNFKKQESPACDVCGYDADFYVKIGGSAEGEDVKYIVRGFCERDLRDAFLDVFNFNTNVPDSLPM